MIQALGAVLGPAVAVAVMPVAILPVILILATPHARRNSSAFTIGALCATLALVLLGTLLASGQNYGKRSGPTLILSVVFLLLALLMWLRALKEWEGIPKKGEEVKLPPWMLTLDKFTAGKSFNKGFLVSGLNSKNTLITLSSAALIAQSGIGYARGTLVAVFYAVIATLGIAAPVIFYFIKGQKAVDDLQHVKTWLSANNNTMQFILLLVLGANDFGKAISGLLP